MMDMSSRFDSDLSLGHFDRETMGISLLFVVFLVCEGGFVQLLVFGDLF